LGPLQHSRKINTLPALFPYCCGAGEHFAPRFDGTVTVNELLTMVNIALGNALVSACSVADATGNGQITVDEILRAVGRALNRCS
jgi:hypothetical protein